MDRKFKLNPVSLGEQYEENPMHIIELSDSNVSSYKI